MDFANSLVTVLISTIFAAGGAWAGIKATLKQNNKDHLKYELHIEKLENRVAEAEKAIIEVFTLQTTWADRLDAMDKKLARIGDDVSYLKGKAA